MEVRDRSRTYNAIGIVFAIFSVAMLLFVIVKLLGPEEVVEVGTLPTQYVPPTATDTLVPTITRTPTWTLIPSRTPSPTDTPSPTFTVPATSTVAPSATITDTMEPTLLPSETPTSSISPTLTPTPTPTGPTPTFTPTDAPYFFTLRGDVTFYPNTVNSAGCAWQGIGGMIFGMDGQETAEVYQVRIFGAGVDLVSYRNSQYGDVSGWEIPIGTQALPGSYFIRVESPYGTALSEDFPVMYPGNCNSNLAIAHFIQTSPIGGPPSS